MFNKTTIFALAATLLAISAPAQAEDCSLKLATSLPMKSVSDGSVGVPIGIDGSERIFGVQPNSAISVIYSDIASELKLPIGRLSSESQFQFRDEVDDSTTYTKQQATISDLKIGRIAGHEVPIRVLGIDKPEPTDGILGLDMLIGFDLELDFKDSTLNLFSQEHCEGKVVYWANSFGTADLIPDNAGLSLIPVLNYSTPGSMHLKGNLDGKSITLSMDPTSADTHMSLQDAEYIYGIKQTDPLLKRIDKGWAVPTYVYPFHSLTLGDVEVKNPQIILYDKPGERICNGTFQLSQMSSCSGMGDILLGMNVLKNLHIFLAIREHRAYITAADAHR